MIQPERFKRFTTKAVAPGVEVILGLKEGESKTYAQSYRFATSKFTVEQAKEWLVKHELKSIAFELASGERQASVKAMQSFVSLKSRGIRALTGVDIMALVPEVTLARIREHDPHPFLQAYSICHEGVSTPTVLGDTARPIHWTRAAVQSIKAKMLKGVKFFLGHNEDNSTEGRPSLGEVVWDGQKEIDGVLHHVVVGYFPDRAAVEDKDICSQEGEWDFVEAAGKWFADKLERITGIALSSSAHDSPAFPGARRLAAVQALEEVEYVDDPEKVDDVKSKAKPKEKHRMDDLTTVPFGELAAEMKRRTTFPSQLFTVEDLKNDRTFGKLFADNEQLDKKAKELAVELEKVKQEALAKDKTLLAQTAKTRFEKLVDGMTLTPKQKAYVKGSFPKTIEDASDEALQKFVSTRLEDYQVAAKAFGVKDELPEQSGDGGKKQNDEGDLTKAAGNELLEDDLEL